MNTNTLLGMILRHAAGVAGAWLIGHGLLDQGQADNFIGAVLVFGAVGASAWDKWGKVRVDADLARAKGIHPVLAAAMLLPFLMLAPTPSSAADLKAPPNTLAQIAAGTCDINGCTGPYLGFQLSGSATGVDVTNLGTLNAATAAVGINGGYQFYDGSYLFGANIQLDYTMLSPADIVNASFSDKFFAFEGIELGGKLAALGGAVGINAIPLPAIFATAIPTIKIGACQNGSLTGYCFGPAAHFFVPNSRFTIDALYLHAEYGSTGTAPGQAQSTDNRGSFGFTYHF